MEKEEEAEYPPNRVSKQIFILLQYKRIKLRISSLYLTVRNAQLFERNEAHGLRCALDAKFGLTQFEYELLYFFDHSRQRTGSVLDEATLSLEMVSQVKRSDFWCREDFWLQDDVPQDSMDVFREYLRHVDDIMEQIDEQIANMKLFKLCRAFGLIPQLSNHEHCFPDYISVMLHVIRDAGLGMHLCEPHSQPDRGGLTLDRKYTKAEELFFPYVLDTYKKWDSAHLSSARTKFEGVLPQRFIDLMLGFHDLARVSHKMTLNEYCRTCVVFSNIQGFRSVGSLVLSKENVQKSLNDISFILVETLTLIGLPRTKSAEKKVLMKVFADRLDRWFKEIVTIEGDLGARDRRIANVKKYASQYDFINDHLENELFLNYKACYTWAMGHLQRYSDKDIPINCSTSEDYHSNETLLQLLKYFKTCVIMFPKDFFQYPIDLYRNLPGESLLHPEETPSESKPPGDMKSNRILWKNESAHFKVDPSRISQGKKSYKITVSTITSIPIPFPDTNVGCQITDSFTVTQSKLPESSRVSKTTRPPSMNTSQVTIAEESTVGRSTEENKIEFPYISAVSKAIESPIGELTVPSEDENDICSSLVKSMAVECSLSGSPESTENTTEISSTLAVEISNASTESSSDENVRVKCKPEFVNEYEQSSSDDEFVIISKDHVRDFVDTVSIEKCVDPARTSEHPSKCSVM